MMAGEGREASDRKRLYLLGKLKTMVPSWDLED